MKKNLKGLLVASLLVSGALQADNSTNKTFMSPRSPGYDLARQLSIWHKQLHRPKDCDECETESRCKTNADRGWGSHWQAVGFYEESTNKGGIGRYFGFNNQNKFTVGTAGAGIDIDNRNLIFNSANSPVNTLAGTMSINGRQKVAGVEIDWYQNLDCFLKGFYFLVGLPIANVKNDIKLDISGQTTQTVGSSTFGIADYFAGNITQAAGIDQQAALTHALIRGSSSKTALDDVQFIVGWDFFRTKCHHVGLNIGTEFPTGDKPHGKKLFEAVSGTNHFNIGAGFTASTTPWVSCDGNQSIEFFFDFRYRYNFKAHETRTLGIIGQNWGQYQFMGTIGSLGVQPAANILTQSVDVTPRNQLNGTAIFSYNLHGFTLDVGYEIFAREKEKVNLKSFNSTLYALAGNNYSATAAFATTNIAASTQTIAATAAETTGVPFTTANLDTNAPATPGFVTNKIYGALGYKWRCLLPLMLKLGGFYEFASSRKTLEKWGIFGGIGVNF